MMKIIRAVGHCYYLVCSPFVDFRYADYDDDALIRVINRHWETGLPYGVGEYLRRHVAYYGLIALFTTLITVAYVRFIIISVKWLLL